MLDFRYRRKNQEERNMILSSAIDQMKRLFCNYIIVDELFLHQLIYEQKALNDAAKLDESEREGIKG